MPRKPAELTVQREDILAAAASVFQERGYHGATMADIAARVHLTAGSLYHHFPAGKRDLLLAVLNESIEAVLAEVQAICAEAAPASDRLRRMILSHVTNVTNNVSFGVTMVFEIRALRSLDGGDAERDRFLKRRNEFEQCFRSVIDEGLAAGEFRRVDVPVFVKAMLGAHNWISVWYRAEGRLAGSQIAAQMADMFLAALRRASPGSH